MTHRLGALRKWAKPRDFDVALAHGSHELTLDRAPARHPELDDVRLRVRDAAAPARLPRGDEGRRARRDPPGATRAVRRAPAEARAVPRPQGGVLPLRLRARPLAARPLRRRSGARARRPAPAARRLALPPAVEPALPDDARPSRPARERARVRAAAHRGAAGVRARARAAVGDPPGDGRRRAEPHRARRPRRLRRRDDEPRGRGARRAGLHDVRRPARRRRRGADPRRPAEAAHRPARARPAQAGGR